MFSLIETWVFVSSVPGARIDITIISVPQKNILPKPWEISYLWHSPLSPANARRGRSLKRTLDPLQFGSREKQGSWGCQANSSGYRGEAPRLSKLASTAPTQLSDLYSHAAKKKGSLDHRGAFTLPLLLPSGVPIRQMLQSSPGQKNWQKCFHSHCNINLKQGQIDCHCFLMQLCTPAVIYLWNRRSLMWFYVFYKYKLFATPLKRDNVLSLW